MESKKNRTKIKSKVEELTATEQELKEVNKRAKELRERKKTLNEYIIKHMKDNDITVLTYGKKTIILEQKKVNSKLKKKEKEDKMKQFFDDKGIDDVEKLMKDLDLHLKGDKVDSFKLKHIKNGDE